MTGSKRLIGISALIVFGTITLAELEKNDRLPTTDQWLGFVLAYFVIAAAADMGLPIAGGFAVLTMVTVLLTRGDEAIKYASESTNANKRQARLHRRGRTAARPAAPVGADTQGATIERISPASAY